MFWSTFVSSLWKCLLKSSWSHAILQGYPCLSSLKGNKFHLKAPLSGAPVQQVLLHQGVIEWYKCFSHFFRESRPMGLYIQRLSGHLEGQAAVVMEPGLFFLEAHQVTRLLIRGIYGQKGCQDLTLHGCHVQGILLYAQA